MGYEQEMALFFSLRCFQTHPAESPSPPLPLMTLQALTRASQSFPDTEQISLSDIKKVQSSPCTACLYIHFKVSPSLCLRPAPVGAWSPAEAWEWAVGSLFLQVHCDGLNCVPWKRYVEVLTPTPQSVRPYLNIKSLQR